jgi:hypothetical protein
MAKSWGRRLIVADVVNSPIPTRRWSRPYSITLSDTVADQNLKRNGQPYLYLQNVGAAGKIMIAWETAATEVDIYLNTGEIIEGGLWRHAKTTGTGAGVELRGFLGVGDGTR